MRVIFLFFLIILAVETYSQRCWPTTSVRTIVRPFKRDPVSCNCSHCQKAITASDSTYSIISYKMTLYSPGDEGPVEKSVDVTGNLFSAAIKRLIDETRSGDTIVISCVKAKHKDTIFVLRPLTLDIK